MPKCISLTHYNLAMHCASASGRLHLDREIVLKQSGLGFDASIAQMFYALVFGGTIIKGDSQGDPTEIAEVMRRQKVTISLIMIFRNVRPPGLRLGNPFKLPFVACIYVRRRGFHHEPRAQVPKAGPP